MQKPVIIGNWKLNGNKKSIHDMFIPLTDFIINNSIHNTIIILPPNLYLDYIYKIIYQKNIVLGSQNIDLNCSGAFTGETSILMLKDIGIKYVLLGHSERRKNHHEDDMLVAKKFQLIKKFNCIPILCIGENKNEKLKNKTKIIIQKQLDLIFNLCGDNAFDRSIIAYEPIWSIGTGIIPDPEYINNIHQYIKNYINKIKIVNHSEHTNTLFIYGGSVNEKNIKIILKEQDVDGVLIGGAALQYNTFSTIIKLSQLH
ncbi:Triosephosphate isomerase [Buchnera aphidicola (Eriosoma grossulariae)]